MDSKFKRLQLAVASAALLAMAGCGGGSSDGASASGGSSGGSPATITFSGSAAVGVPLVGTVMVKDALGASKTVPIGANGAYSIDVTGMTAPFVFRASGTANGQQYTVHSIATAADAAGKINITQLTDLVVANIAGQIAQNYFDKFEQNSNASAATKAAIDAEVGKLKEKLLPILTALGVDVSIDLLRTPFTPLADALDKALDVIQVSVDPNTNLATISSVANAVTIIDDLAVKAAAETAPATLSADNVATAVSDTDLVKKALTDFAAKFATGLPSPAQVTPLITSGFLHHDINGTDFAIEASSFSALVGGSIDNIEIHNIDYTDLTRITARVSFTFRDKNGLELEREQNWRVRKSATDGIWRLHGDQRVLDLSAYSHMVKSIMSTGTCVLTGLEFDIENYIPNNEGGVISYVMVTGPGLPSGGLRYEALPAGSGQWKINGQPTPYYIMGNSCFSGAQAVPDSVIATIPDNAVYVFTAYDSVNAKITFPSGTADGSYGIKVQRRPLTLAEAVAATTFPVITSPASIADFSSYSSGALTIAAGYLNPARFTWLYLAQNTNTSDFRQTETDVAAASNGTLSTSLSLPPAASGTINMREMRVASQDAYRRNMMTIYKVQP